MLSAGLDKHVFTVAFLESCQIVDALIELSQGGERGCRILTWEFRLCSGSMRVEVGM